jgi:serine/threonine protein kinase
MATDNAGLAALPEHFGRYRILRQLGEGGMGRVYLAHDSQSNRQVALKVPHFTVNEAPAVVQRFQQEARLAATLRHHSICQIQDWGQIDGIHYLTMDYIEGQTLAACLRSGQQFSPWQAAALVRNLALAMAEAHRRGVIHRDLKPSNVMMDQRGVPLIMDFGLARLIDGPQDTRLTRTGNVLGTPAYMAPEQALGDTKAIGPNCDIYSLGVILYELLTGQLPFQGATPMAVLLKIATEEPPRPSTYRSEIDPQLEEICLKAMAKKVENRYPAMIKLADALAGFLQRTANQPAGSLTSRSPLVSGPSAHSQSSRPITKLRSAGSFVELASPTEQAFDVPRRRRDAAHRHTVFWVLLVIMVIAVTGVMTAFILHSLPDSSTHTGRVSASNERVEKPRDVESVGAAPKVEQPGEHGNPALNLHEQVEKKPGPDPRKDGPSNQDGSAEAQREKTGSEKPPAMKLLPPPKMLIEYGDNQPREKPKTPTGLGGPGMALPTVPGQPENRQEPIPNQSEPAKPGAPDEGKRDTQAPAKGESNKSLLPKSGESTESLDKPIPDERKPQKQSDTPSKAPSIPLEIEKPAAPTVKEEQELAISSTHTGNAEIFLISAEGRVLKNLTQNGAEDRVTVHPSLSSFGAARPARWATKA